MKKKIIALIILAIAVLIACLTGCNPKDSQTIWAECQNKESVDVIRIENLDFSRLIVVNKAKLTISRKFEKDKTTINVLLDEPDIDIKLTAKFLLTTVIDQLRKNLGIDIYYADVEKLITTFQSLQCELVLSENNTKLAYKITPKFIDTDEDSVNVISGELTIDSDADYNNVVNKTLDLLTCHFSSIFVPTKNNKVEINPIKLNDVFKAAVTYQESIDPNKDDKDYVQLSTKINRILGVGHYTQFLTNKIKINESKCQTVVEKKFITSMDITLNKVQFMYNKTQLMQLIKTAVQYLDPDSASQVDMLSSFITELTEGESCIEIQQVTIKSKYLLK